MRGEGALAETNPAHRAPRRSAQSAEVLLMAARAAPALQGD